MPRAPRKRSDSGLYHVMLRGINKQRIFHEEGDYQSFLQALRIYRDKCPFQLLAWCLMPNHVHLLIKELPEGDNISQIMKRVGTKYVYWYNLRNERNGPLFQGRFSSEVIKGDAHFLTVLRYIHRNPVKAGIATSLQEYPYSSFRSYLSDDIRRMADTALLFSIIDKNQYIPWHMKGDYVHCLDIEEAPSARAVPDDKALLIMKRSSGADNAEGFLLLSNHVQTQAIISMRKAGASVRQMNRWTGANMAFIRKVTRQ